MQKLGERLREARLGRNETQEVFAARIGLSRQTYAKMEHGAGAVPLVSWLAASEILGRLDTWQGVLTGEKRLFDRFEVKRQRRKRATGKRG